MPYRAQAGTRRWFAAAVAAAALAATACANVETPADPQTTPAPPTDEVVAWTDSACSALSPVVEAVRTPPAVDLDDPASTRQAYLDYLGSTQERADQALQAVEEAGPPPVPGGEELVRDVRDQLTDLQNDLDDARRHVETADARDLTGVAEAVVAAGNVIGSLGNTAHAVAVISGDPQLRPAFEQAQSCDDLRVITDPS